MPEYTLSLAFWIVPLILMAADLARRGLPPKNQKKALLINVGVLAVVGILLDLLFANAFFVFPDPKMTLGWTIRGIPIEEFIFYVTGFWFILLLYVYCDEYFLLRYNKPDRLYYRFANRLRRRIYLFLEKKVLFRVGLYAAAVVTLKLWLNPEGGLLPGYALFLGTTAIIPFFAFWKVTRFMLNFRAFILTMVITTLIAVIWEVTLALPRGYWDYKHGAMVGIFIDPWHGLPIEAVSVWIFSSLIILSYEFTKIAFFRAEKGHSLNQTGGPLAGTPARSPGKGETQ